MTQRCFVCTKEADFQSKELSEEFLLMVNILDLPESFSERNAEKLSFISYCTPCWSKIHGIQVALAQLEKLEEQVLRHKFEIESHLKNVQTRIPVDPQTSLKGMPALDVIRNEIATELKSRALRGMLSKLQRKPIDRGVCRNIPTSNSNEESKDVQILKDNTTGSVVLTTGHPQVKTTIHSVSSSTQCDEVSIRRGEPSNLNGFQVENPMDFNGVEEAIEYNSTEYTLNDPISIEMSSTQYFPCAACGRIFEETDELMTHTLGCIKVEYEEPAASFTFDAPDNDNVPFVIPTTSANASISVAQRSSNRTRPKSNCSKKPKTRNPQEKQMEEVPPKKHKCDKCSRSYSTSRSLKTHMKNHSEPRCKCNVCGKPFFRTDSLFRHKQSCCRGRSSLDLN